MAVLISFVFSSTIHQRLTQSAFLFSVDAVKHLLLLNQNFFVQTVNHFEMFLGQYLQEETITLDSSFLG